MENSHNEGEINLIDLLRSIFNFFRKNSLFFIISLFIGCSLGLIKTLLEKPIYKSNLVAVSNVLNTEDATSIIDKCKTLIEDGNIAELGKILQIDSVDAGKIAKMSVTSQIIPSIIKKEETVLITNKFNFEVEVSDYNLFPKLNISIPEAIRNNQYTKLKTELILYTKEKIYNKLEIEIKQLDSIKKNMTPGLVNGKSTFFITNPSLIYESIVKLYEQQMGIYMVLNTRQDLLIIEDFAILKKPYNKKSSFYIKNILLFAFITFGLAFLVAIYKELLVIVKK